jgi:hypothetical protein
LVRLTHYAEVSWTGLFDPERGQMFVERMGIFFFVLAAATVEEDSLSRQNPASSDSAIYWMTDNY